MADRQVERREGTKRFNAVPFAFAGVLLLIYSVDRLVDLWGTDQTWRIGLYVVTAAAAIGGLVVVLRRPPAAPTLPDMSAPWVDEAKRILASGDKMGAIKAVRQATNLGLAEAKRLVESWHE